MNLFILILAIASDIIFGEPPAWAHPVVYMGKLTEVLRRFVGGSKISGVILTLTVTIIFAGLAQLTLFLNETYLKIIISGFLLSTVFSIRLLIKSALNIKESLKDSEIAKKELSNLVSRDTQSLTDDQIISATIETLTENLTDSVTAPIIYFIVFGLPGAFFYRSVNTLDAMVGYLDDEHRYLGWFPAKLDDILNYIPARITGFLMVLSAFLIQFNWKKSFKIILRDARNPPSPNSGYTMAAAAGALSVRLEKPGAYEIGDPEFKLGPEKIDEAVKLTGITILIFLVLVISLYWGVIN